MNDPRLIGLVLGLLWIGWCLPSGSFGLLNGIIVYTHEGGHLICMPFMPRLITIAAGTGMQLLMPALIMAGFYYRAEKYSAAITSLWLAASLRYASVYAQDAIDKEKPLLFTGMSASEEMETYGETTHDFINMLDILHLPLGLAHGISALLFLGAIASWLGAAYLGFQALGIKLAVRPPGTPPPPRT